MSFQASLTALCSKHSSVNYKGIIHQFWKKKKKKNLTCARKAHKKQAEFLQLMDGHILFLCDNPPLLAIGNNELLNS